MHVQGARTQIWQSIVTLKSTLLVVPQAPGKWAIAKAAVAALWLRCASSFGRTGAFEHVVVAALWL